MSEEGVVVVSDLRIPPGIPGHYGLVRAKDWHSPVYPTVQIWKGPEKPFETLYRKEIKQVFCKTVAVDPHGFFICIPLSGEERERVFFSSIEVPEEELAEMAIKEGEELLNEFANEKAAEHWSYVTDDWNDYFNGEVWVMASFGDATAVNGEVVGVKRKPPKGYIFTNRGGRIPSGEEEEIEVDYLAEVTAKQLSAKIGLPIEKSKILKIFNDRWKKNYIYWTSDSGNVEVWVSTKANKAYERKLEKEAIEEELKRQKEAKEAKARQLEERRAKIRRGGFPTILDWSPTGELPED